MLSLLALGVPTVARAQTSVTGELTAAGTVDVSFDFLGSLARRSAGGFEWYLPAIAVGLRDHLEVGAGLSHLVPRSADEPQELVPAVRWQWLETRHRSTATVGAAWHVPNLRRTSHDAYGIVHATFAQQLFQGRPATLEVGGYALVDRASSSGDTRRGLIAEWDQTLSPHWSYALDWMSGNNWYGYFSITMTRSTDTYWMSAGYCVGNQPAHNHGPCVSVGRSF